MTFGDIAVIIVIALAITGAVIKIIHDKKKGRKCTGCSQCCDKCPYK